MNVIKIQVLTYDNGPCGKNQGTGPAAGAVTGGGVSASC
jgi:hypothetical protein